MPTYSNSRLSAYESCPQQYRFRYVDPVSIPPRESVEAYLGKRVHEALEEIGKLDERLARLVEMRYFGGLSDLEIAEGLGITDRTVRREWQKARVLLASSLG